MLCWIKCETLLDRKFPAVYIKLLLDSYINQSIRAQWGNSVSEQFHGVNGIRQGGVLSPILFTVYMDRLISKLKNHGSGCWVGHHFYGCLIYADDVVLICPSATGLQNMIDTCAEFGLENAVTFNEKKTICIKYGENEKKPDFMLNGKKLKWDDKFKHVGNIVNSTLDDEEDIVLKKQECFGQVNKMMSGFQGVNCDIIAELFRKYCISFYGSQAWDLRSMHIQGLYRAWNRGVRRVLDLPYTSHCFLLPNLLNMPRLEVKLIK